MLKRFFDILGSMVLLVATLPLMLILSALVRSRMGAPVFFRQVRPGLEGQLFTVYKFRTMANGVDENGELLPDRNRLTPFGNFMRKASLDELPQLLNVLKGDMSLVGPRPLLVEYLPLYSPAQARRHEVRPGITGWAQVNGRNAVDWDERFALDVWYVDNRSMLLDIRILVMTALKVLRRDGIAAKGEATMSKFAGNRESRV